MKKASSASEHLGGNMENVSTAAQQSSSAADESPAAIGRIVKTTDIAVKRAFI